MQRASAGIERYAVLRFTVAGEGLLKPGNFFAQNERSVLANAINGGADFAAKLRVLGLQIKVWNVHEGRVTSLSPTHKKIACHPRKPHWKTIHSKTVHFLITVPPPSSGRFRVENVPRR